MESKEQFEFKVSGEYEKPAIWLGLHGKEVKIFPLPLFEMLWDCYQRRRVSPGIEAKFQIFPENVFGYYYDDSCGSYSIEYERDVFIQSAINALTALCKHVIDGNDTLYSSFTNETAEQMLTDLHQIVIPKNYSQIFYDEVSIEDFNFRFLEPYSCDTPYVNQDW